MYEFIIILRVEHYFLCVFILKLFIGHECKYCKYNNKYRNFAKYIYIILPMYKKIWSKKTQKLSVTTSIQKVLITFYIFRFLQWFSCFQVNYCFFFSSFAIFCIACVPATKFLSISLEIRTRCICNWFLAVVVVDNTCAFYITHNIYMQYW